MSHRCAVYLEVTSWRGISVGAEHWYGHLDHFGDELERRELRRRMGAQEAAALTAKDGLGALPYREGDTTERFPSEAAVVARARRVWRRWFPGARILVQGDGAIAEPQRVLSGDRDARVRINRLVRRADEIGRWDAECEMERICAEWDAIMLELEA